MFAEACSHNGPIMIHDYYYSWLLLFMIHAYVACVINIPATILTSNGSEHKSLRMEKKDKQNTLSLHSVQLDCY